MRLSDIMSAMDLAVFPEIGLVIFIGVFIALALKTFRTPNNQSEEAARIPLSDEPVNPRTPPGKPSE